MDINCSGTVAWYALERGKPFSIEMRTQLAVLISKELSETLGVGDYCITYTIRAVHNIAFDLQTSSNEGDDNAVNVNNVNIVAGGSDVLAIEGNSFPIHAISALRGRKWVYIALFDRTSGKFLRWQKYNPGSMGGCHHEGSSNGCGCGNH